MKNYGLLTLILYLTKYGSPEKGTSGVVVVFCISRSCSILHSCMLILA